MRKRKWKENRRFAGLLAAELLFLLACAAVMLFRQNAVYTCEPQSFSATEEGGSASEVMTLPRGVYRVELRYACQGNMQNFANMVEIGERGALRSSGEHLSGGLGYTSFEIWVRERTEVRLEISAGSESLEILGLSIYQTDGDVTRILTAALAFFLLADAGILLGRRAREGEKPGCTGQWAETFAGVFLITMAASIPVFVGYVYPGSDVTYHLLRIDNLKDGRLSGQFPVRIDPSWLWGHGYASSVCYGETLLYIPALMRLLGFTLQESYMTFLFLLNLGTCLVSFFCFRGIFRSRRLGLLCSAVYTLSIYRLYKMYSWSALGEAQAMLWLPLILYAVYRLLAEETGEAGYGKRWIPLAVGFSGIIQCHVLTCELTVFFLAVVCVVFWKRLFRKETLLAFWKGVLGTCALSAWFVVPFLEYTLGVDMVIRHVSARTIQQEGLYPANLLFAFFHRGVGRDLELNGMRDMEALGVGISVTAAAGLFCFLWFWGFLREQKEDRSLVIAGKTALVLGVAAMCMSLAVFPWNAVQSWNPVLQVLVSSVQYPNRFLMTATLVLVLAGGVALACVGKRFGRKAMGGTGACILAVAVVTALFYLSSIVTDGGSLYMYDAKGMGTGYLSGGEYLRYGADLSLYSYHGPVAGGNVEIESWEKEWLDMELSVNNRGDGEGYVDLPLQNYRGYRAETDDGRRLEICDGENKDLRILIPAGFEGGILVGFRPPWYWRLAEAVSCLSVAGLLAGRLVPAWKKRGIMEVFR